MAKADEDDTSTNTVFTVPDEHRAAVVEGLDQSMRGKFATDEEMARLWERCSL
jgi:predicted transcriptional regulator